ncbi:hypothetical protein L1987_43158 [Smallanthus sonchifolius]|uniref:Uncharacterized protein n=1 Tax=Smallanthus sonchifolius TaxID=185202 RepID=A0ACB9GLV6_9ASTR|nr:hypothetical protein L1987_43158 [Smallanthus sonchifolius]
MNDSSTYGTPIPVNHGLHPDKDGKDVDCKLYRGMIGSLMYLTASRPDIMFVQSFDFKAYTDSDYGGCNLDRKSTSGGCQFLGDRLVSWQCKKQSTVSVSTCEAEYIAATSGCSQILWIQQQLRDYGLNFTGTPLFIDNNTTMFITNNPVKHSKTKHIEIRHHFIRDCTEKHLIELIKVHTDDNFADFFTKAFDRSRFEHLVNLIECSIQKMARAFTTYPVVSRPYLEQFLDTVDHDCTRQRMGYVGVQDYSSYKKMWVLDQWRYFTHVMIMCISSRKAEKDAMGHDLAAAMVGLSLSRGYNFSRYIFKALNDQINTAERFRFLLYPRFVQLLINDALPNLPAIGERLQVKRVDKRVFAQFQKPGGVEPTPEHTALFGHLINEAYVAPADWRWFSHDLEPELSEHSDEQQEDEAVESEDEFSESGDEEAGNDGPD